MENLSSKIEFASVYFGNLFDAVYEYIKPLTEIANGASQLLGMFK